MKLLTGELNINDGTVFENFVAQEFIAHGFGGSDQSLYYFNSKKQGELDFVLEQNGDVLPIEVKSGKDYERHNALKNVMENDGYGVKQAFVLCNGNVVDKGRVCYVPAYMTMFMRKHPAVERQIVQFDMSGLG